MRYPPFLNGVISPYFRLTGRAIHQVRVCHQFEHGQGAPHRSAADAVCTRRRDNRMKRREFITLVGCVAAWPLAAQAQQSKPEIGFINAASAQSYARQLAAFLKGLAETGYIDDRNVAIQYRWAEGQNDRLPEMAADLVRRKVAVIAATSTP